MSEHAEYDNYLKIHVELKHGIEKKEQLLHFALQIAQDDA
jgi:hypothetical protein